MQVLRENGVAQELTCAGGATKTIGISCMHADLLCFNG